MAPKKGLSLIEKEAIIRAKDAGESNYSIANRLDRQPSTIRTVYKNEQTVLDAIGRGKNLKLKRLKMARYPEVDTSTFGWFCQPIPRRNRK